MTAEEALTINKRSFLVDHNGDTDATLIEAQYVAIDAIGKQIKLVAYPRVVGENERAYLCPGCKRVLRTWHPNYCEICGQAIDWSEVE